jgi:HEAT repeat protein
MEMRIFDAFRRGRKGVEVDEDVEDWIQTLTRDYGSDRLDAARLRPQAAEILASKGERAVEPLIRVVSDRRADYNVRNGAAWALGVIGDARAIDPLAEAIKKRGIGLEAVRALGRIKDVRAIERLVEILKDDELYPEDRSSAAEALAMIGEPGLTPLVEALADEDSKVRLYAADALGRMKDARAVEPLLNALNDESNEVRNQAVMALGDLKDARAIEALTRALTDEDEHVRANAKHGLQRIKAKQRREQSSSKST